MKVPVFVNVWGDSSNETFLPPLRLFDARPRSDDSALAGAQMGDTMIDEEELEDFMDDFDHERDNREDALMNCGLMRDGNCSMAGSEYCDWECPFSS